jgi:hypothetical protein
LCSVSFDSVSIECLTKEDLQDSLIKL